MQGVVINPVRGELVIGSKRYPVGFLDVGDALKISFLSTSVKPPASGKATLDGKPILIDEVRSESPFTPNRTWTLFARYAEVPA